jgi:hypothetical protein
MFVRFLQVLVLIVIFFVMVDSGGVIPERPFPTENHSMYSAVLHSCSADTSLCHMTLCPFANTHSCEDAFVYLDLEAEVQILNNVSKQ